MQTTLVGQTRNSNMQLMGETREPMASDCWTDANRLAEMYSKSLGHDFWVLYAAKPDATRPNAVIAGWEIVAKKPPAGMVGVMVFKWSHQDKQLTVEPELCLPYDVPLSESELSGSSKDITLSLGLAAQKSGAIFLA